MKLFMSVDLEGFAGISFWHEIDARDPASSRYMRSVTDQIVTLCKALRERYSDLEMITICDSHARGTNIIWDELPEYTELIRGFPRRYYMMEGLDSEYDGIVFAGYHVGAGKQGNMDHTYSASVMHEIRLNGKVVNELAINSYFAGEYSVPVIMALGGDLFVEEALGFDRDITTCVLKEEYGRYSGKSFSPAKVRENITKAVSKLRMPGDYSVHRLEQPVEMTLEFRDTAAAEIASLVPGAKREHRKVTLFCKNMIETYEVLMLIVFASGRAVQIR